MTVMPYPSHTAWPDVECKREGGCRECKARVGKAHSPEGGSGTRCPRSSHAAAVGVWGWLLQSQMSSFLVRKSLMGFPTNSKALCTRKSMSILVLVPSCCRLYHLLPAAKQLIGPTLGHSVKTEGNLRKVRPVIESCSLESGRHCRHLTLINDRNNRSSFSPY